MERKPDKEMKKYKENSCGKKNIFVSFTGKSVILCLLLGLLSFSYGCSEKKSGKLPKTHPELLLEITEEAGKGNHKGMLPKITRLRAIDPSCAFIGELENVSKMNILVKEINFLVAQGKFYDALKRVEYYERLNGPDRTSAKVKQDISNLILLEKHIDALKNPPNSTRFARDLALLESLNKKVKFSPGIRNFVREKRSELQKFRVAEQGYVCFGLWSDALDMKKNEDPSYPVLAAILNGSRKDFPGFHILFQEELSSGE